MLDFLFKKEKISLDAEKLLYIHIEAGVLSIYDIMPGWLLSGQYEDMKKHRGLLGKYLITNRKNIKKISTQLSLIPDIGTTMGFLGASDYITEVISEKKYHNLRKNPPSEHDVEKICNSVSKLVIKEVEGFLKLNGLL